MLGFVEILSGPTADTGPCLLVHFESKRYLFGHVAEGTQRVLVGRKMSTRSMEEIFLSGPVRWRSAGGLLGMLLTLGDAAASARAAAEEENRKRAQRGKKLRQASFAALNIHGARNLTHMLATARGFVFRKGFPMRPHEVRTDPRAAAATDGGSDGGSMTSAEPDWQDSNLKVWYVPITCAGEKRASRKRSHDMIEDADGGGQETGASRAKSRDRDGSVAEERVVPDIVQSADDAPGRILVSQASPVQGDVEVSGAPPAGSVAEEATSAGEMVRARDTETSRPTNQVSAESVPNLDQDHHQVRLQIVHDMFNSNWRLDTLEEVSLRDVPPQAAVFVRDDKGSIVQYQGPLPGAPGGDSSGSGSETTSSAPPGDLKVLVRTPWPSAKVPALPPTRPASDSLCYIVKNQDRRGKFLVAKARELGVAVTDYKLLTGGQSVPGKDGITVTPDMVLEPVVPGHGFAVLDIPEPRYVESFLARPEWSCEAVMRNVDAMYWISTSRDVFDDPRIVSFMRERPSVRHVVLAPGVCPNRLMMERSATETIKLHGIDPERFPIPVYNNAPGISNAAADASPPFQVGQPGAAFQLCPQVLFQDDKTIPFLDTAAPVREIQDRQPEILALAAAARAKLSDPSFVAEVDGAERDAAPPCRDAEVVTLGTGSALPSKSRNVSATLVRVPGCGSYLLDCGENTLGQLRRLYGPEGADEVVRDLRAIWISHLHADHHLGTVSVIRRFKDLAAAATTTTQGEESPQNGRRGRRLAVIAHRKFLNFLAEYEQVEPFGSGVVVPISITSHPRAHPPPPAAPAAPAAQQQQQPLSEAAASEPSTSSPSSQRPNTSRKKTVGYWALGDEALARDFGLARVEACSVDHCQDAMAVVLTFATTPNDNKSNNNNNTKGLLRVAYSGDCRPSPALAALGRGADLLVHECTFDDALAGDAVAKKHSTLSEALGVARDMGARKVLLTHFSQRYPNIQGVRPGSGEANGSVAVDAPVLLAFDYMRVRLGDFRKAELFLPAIKKLYEGLEKDGPEMD